MLHNIITNEECFLLQFQYISTSLLIGLPNLVVQGLLSYEQPLLAKSLHDLF